MIFFLILTAVLSSYGLLSQSYFKQPAHKSNDTTLNITLSTYKDYNTNGYMAIIDNPIDHFHVYYPELDNHSCGGRADSSETAAKKGCILATNGGPFNMVNTNDTCQGLIVSDGVVVLKDYTQFESFGLTKDGDFVFGDIQAADIGTLNLDQLITGFGWLVEEGKIIPDQGGEIAPRTAIGTDKEGRLMIFEADGEEDIKSGLTLYQTAVWFQKLGGYNVINLDGGGSSVMYYQQKVISKPTCDDTPKICERAVTTITCVK